jgi:hypothetical protein
VGAQGGIEPEQIPYQIRRDAETRSLGRADLEVIAGMGQLG